MNLEQIAQQAMSYLDSVGVAADYEIKKIGKSAKTESLFNEIYFKGVSDDFRLLITTTSNRFFLNSVAENVDVDLFFDELKTVHPQKSPN